MEDTSSPRRVEASLSPARKAWAEPAIVLERSLEVVAEGVPPAGRRGPRVRSNGFVGFSVQSAGEECLV
jgi:hypothetical protein